MIHRGILVATSRGHVRRGSLSTFYGSLNWQRDFTFPGTNTNKITSSGCLSHLEPVVARKCTTNEYRFHCQYCLGDECNQISPTSEFISLVCRQFFADILSLSLSGFLSRLQLHQSLSSPTKCGTLLLRFGHPLLRILAESPRVSYEQKHHLDYPTERRLRRAWSKSVSFGGPTNTLLRQP